jgi:hypothetical protein
MGFHVERKIKPEVGEQLGTGILHVERNRSQASRIILAKIGVEAQ